MDEKLKDLVLDKFRGNKSFNWEQIRDISFYKNIHTDYYVIENTIKFLLADKSLIYEFDISKQDRFLRLSDKGFYMISDLNKLGYVKSYKTKRSEKAVNLTIQIAILIITILTFFLALKR